MAEKPKEVVKKIDPSSVVHVEFLIDDLIKRLISDHGHQVANCNGCNSCSSAADRPNIQGGR
jgi:hypothetical protein